MFEFLIHEKRKRKTANAVDSRNSPTVPTGETQKESPNVQQVPEKSVNSLDQPQNKGQGLNSEPIYETSK